MPDALPLPEKRKPLTRRQFAELILRQEGRCGCGCGVKLVADRIIDEHLNPLDSLGSNDLTNRALFSKDCAARKTERDRRERDKGRRLRGETCAGPKKAIPSRPASWGERKGVSALSKDHKNYRKPVWK
jgi:hypothetical protein